MSSNTSPISSLEQSHVPSPVQKYHILLIALTISALIAGILALSGVKGFAQMGHSGGGALVGIASLLFIIACMTNYFSNRKIKTLKILREKIASEIMKDLRSISLKPEPFYAIEISLYTGEKKFNIIVQKDESDTTIQKKVTALCHELQREEGSYEIRLKNNSIYSGACIFSSIY